MNFLPGTDLNLHPHALPEGSPNGVSFHHETIEGYAVPKQGWDGVLLPFHPGKLNGGTNREQDQGASSRLRRKGTCLLNDRLRRQRISERIVALQLLVPNSKQGGPSSALDEITTYIQHLQLQLEDLSTSTLGAKAAPGNHPLILPQCVGLGTYTRGYGPEAKNDIRGPVGELMGKLMEERPMLARQLLESKGLFLVPTTLVPELGLRMDYIPVYHWLQEIFPQIDSRLLEVTAKHSKDADAAVEYILTEVLPLMTEKEKVSSRNLSAPCSYDLEDEQEDQSSLPRQSDGSNRLANSLIKGPVTDTIQAQSSVNIGNSTAVEESSFYDAIDEHDLPSEILDVEVVTDILVSQDALEARDTNENQITELKDPTILHACDDGQSKLCRNAEAGRLILLGKGMVKETIGSCSNSSCITATATLANSLSGLHFSGTVDSDDTDHWKSSDREPHSNGPSAGADDIRIHVILPPYQLNPNSQELESTAFSNHNGSLEDNAASLDCTPNAGVEDVEAATITSKPGCSGWGNPREDDGSPLEVMAARSEQICNINLLEQIIDDAKNNKKTLFSAVESVINMMKEVEDRERAAEMAKEEAEMGGVDVLTKVMELKQMLVHAKDANNMHAGEVYGEKAVLATEVRELQSRLSCLSDERDKALSILDEMSKIMESRILEADEARLATEKEKLKKEEFARAAMAEQEAIMDKVVQESKILQEAAEENSRLRDFLMDRGRVVDILQGEISVICQDVRLLKEKFDAQVPLSQSVSSSQTSRRSLSNSLNIDNDEAMEIPEKSNEQMSFGGVSSKDGLEEDRPKADTWNVWDWEFFDKDTESNGLLGNGNGRSV